jgi:hypothetical protein
MASETGNYCRGERDSCPSRPRTVPQRRVCDDRSGEPAATPAEKEGCRLITASPEPRYHIPPAWLCLTRHTEVHSSSARPALPLPVATGRLGSPSAPTLGVAPQRGRTYWLTSGRVQTPEYWPRATHSANRTTRRSAHSQRATSCRTARSNNDSLGNRIPASDSGTASAGQV